VVLDLGRAPHDRKPALVERALARIRDLRRRRGPPHWVVVDEAHHALGGPSTARVDVEDKGFCLVTHRASWLRPAIAEAMDVFVVARTTATEEIAFLERHLASCRVGARALAVLPALPDREFLVIQCEPGDGATAGEAPVWTALTVVAAPRQTEPARRRELATNGRLAAPRRFRFVGGVEADSLAAFRRGVAAAVEAVLAEHAGRGDFSRWVLQALADEELARQLAKAEARWRRGEVSDLRGAIGRLIAFDAPDR
jgi:hypothetical protein